MSSHLFDLLSSRELRLQRITAWKYIGGLACLVGLFAVSQYLVTRYIQQLEQRIEHNGWSEQLYQELKTRQDQIDESRMQGQEQKNWFMSWKQQFSPLELFERLSENLPARVRLIECTIEVERGGLLRGAARRVDDFMVWLSLPDVARYVALQQINKGERGEVVGECQITLQKQQDSRGQNTKALDI